MVNEGRLGPAEAVTLIYRMNRHHLRLVEWVKRNTRKEDKEDKEGK